MGIAMWLPMPEQAGRYRSDEHFGGRVGFRKHLRQLSRPRPIETDLTKARFVAPSFTTAFHNRVPRAGAAIN